MARRFSSRPARAQASVSGPTRPKYISGISTQCEAGVSVGVLTLERPVVLKAEMVSKRMSRKSCPLPRSIMLMRQVAARMTA